MVVIPFTRDLSLMPAFEFAEEILFSRLHAIEVHEGFNFRFGHKAEGNMVRLCEFGQKLGFTVVTHAPDACGARWSSPAATCARWCWEARWTPARHLLGRVFSIDSTTGARARIWQQIHGSNGEPGALR